MNRIASTIAAATFILGAASLPATAARENADVDHFITMCDTDRDGMVSKQELMKQVEKMFDQQDTRKAGKIDKTQVEFFLRELMKSGA